jgi:hypothetical protein
MVHVKRFSRSSFYTWSCWLFLQGLQVEQLACSYPMPLRIWSLEAGGGEGVLRKNLMGLSMLRPMLVFFPLVSMAYALLGIVNIDLLLLSLPLLLLLLLLLLLRLHYITLHSRYSCDLSYQCILEGSVES